jgi:hypothetical protein
MDKHRISIDLQHQGCRRMDDHFRKISKNTFGPWKPNTQVERPWLVEQLGKKRGLIFLKPGNNGLMKPNRRI